MNQPPNLTREPVPGDLLGEFRILHEIGAGAMGKVYEARQESLQRRVALKVLPDDARGSDANAVTRFYREARAAAQLNHPNIVPVYGFGVEGGSYYFAMQYVQGRSLGDLIQQGPVDERAAATYMLHVARGLDAAHGQGVVHRDIKPANIMIREEDDQAVITDFGLSRHERVKSITQSGALLGTPVYMSPEQARGDKVDARADVYSLGATFYEALTGQVPFTETNLRGLLVAITSSDPVAPSELRPISPDLEAIVLKAMAKEPGDRYGTCKALAEDLLRFLRGEIVLARSAGPVEQVLAYLRRNPLVLVLSNVLVGLIVIMLIAVPWLIRRGPVGQATAALAAAREELGERLDPYREAAAALDEARAARESQVRTLEAGARDGAFDRARFAAQEFEDALFPAGSADGPGDLAVTQLRRAVAVGPPDHPAVHEARELLALLLQARERSARRRGEERLAAISASERSAVSAAAPAPGHLAVETVPPGAKLFLYAIHEEDGAFALDDVQALGKTPLPNPPELERGDYLVKLHAQERAETTFPVRIEPGRTAEYKVELPALEGVPPGFVFVAPGEFQAGGDPLAVRPLFRTPEPVWVGAFFIGQYEVRVKEYLDFLADLPPAERRGHLPVGTNVIRVVGGRLEADPDVLEHPIAGVSPASARAYCRWRTSRTPGGPTFRLPTDVEWEKAARGPLGWAFPWGDRFDPAARPPRAHLHQLDQAEGVPTRPAGSHPGDVSIYGVFDLGGNVSEWVDGSFGASDRFSVLRGGSWARGPEPTRAASREAVHADQVAAVAPRAGFRLAFDPIR